MADKNNVEWGAGPYISKVQLTGGTYYIKDAEARELIKQLESALRFLGVTTTVLTDGSTTNPIQIGGKSVTAVTGDVVIYGSKEFVWDGSKWCEFGDMGDLKQFAYVDSGITESFTVSGNVTAQTVSFTNGALEGATYMQASGATGEQVATDVTGDIRINDATTYAYTPSGNITGSATTESITSTGKFTPEGNITGSITIPAHEASATYTPTGTVSQPTFTGDNATIDATFAPAGTVSQPTFTGTELTSTGKFTPAGTVTAPTVNSLSAAVSIGYTPKGEVDGTITMKELESTGSYIPEGDVDYSGGITGKAFTGTGSFTPNGSITQQAVYTVNTTEKDVVTSGTPANWSAQVASDETLSFTWVADTITMGTINEANSALTQTAEAVWAGSDTTVDTTTTVGFVKTELPTLIFTGSADAITVKGTPEVDSAAFGFTGSATTLTQSAPVTGTINAPTFTGTEGTVTVKGTPEGTVSQPTFTGTSQKYVSVSYTPTGTVSQPTFTGDNATITSSVETATIEQTLGFSGTEGDVSVTNDGVKVPATGLVFGGVSHDFAVTNTLQVPAHSHTIASTETNVVGGTVSVTGAPVTTGTYSWSSNGLVVTPKNS